MVADRVAVVTGANGQDGYFLVDRLLRDGWVVHAVARRPLNLEDFGGSWHAAALTPHQVDILDEPAMSELLRVVQPEEFYNLAGQSSVSQSFEDPHASWRTNAESVFLLLEAVRRETPMTRVYQSSSGEMFGWGDSTVHNERSRLDPQSPYAAAKAAAHLVCGMYRRVFGLRVACGILFNHESHRRPGQFLTRKVVDHVRELRDGSTSGADVPPLGMGNLRAKRDWGFAPDYVDGMLAIIRQVSVRAARRSSASVDDAPDEYRDYVLATGQLHAVWQFVDRAFALAGFDLDWDLDSADPVEWRAVFRGGSRVAVFVDPRFLRPTDPPVIAADPTLAQRELGWRARGGLDQIIGDMLANG